ncbi:MarR family winged helix-turn-helix transcriptional regulator [Sphingomonas aerophila]|uniref:DNA-binding MarR family transcriptional regulator n=1 Tax=Sphingomonas aerophila TaxID=1344948 RepID=A0A7W9BBH7_9SPHN|nr:MarR family transcriptional regulator [Sphingomonas aerophila]MBB5714174.1 DNA-binding MarR family transcriptional regulator [Sphingomonas aerophila]
MVDYIESHGNAFLAHRLRRSSDRVVDQVGTMLSEMGLDVPPRGASMLLLIDDQRQIGVVEISRHLRLSHPLIVRMAREFQERGLVNINSDPSDGRRRVLSPTEKGRREAVALRDFNSKIGAMFDDVFAEIGAPVSSILDQFDAALDATPISKRLAKLI